MNQHKASHSKFAFSSRISTDATMNKQQASVRVDGSMTSPEQTGSRRELHCNGL